MRAAYLGPRGTFTEKVAKLLFPKQELIPLQPIRNVIMAVEAEKVDFAVVPIENFYNGEVRETLDALTDCIKARIIKEKSMPIIHCLGALKNHGKICSILSKDQALEQCSSYLCKNYPEASTMALPSTSEAVNRIKQENLLDAAVIASKKFIQASGLKLIGENLVPNNKTRFIIVGRNKTKVSGDDKTFLAVHPPVKDKPGVLYNTLGFFSSFGINLEDIKSRPDKKDGYYFYIELDGHESDKAVSMALEAVKFFLDPENKSTDTIKVLGSYKNSHWKK